MSLEYPCVYYENEKCKKFSVDGVTSWCLQGPCNEQKMSEADRICATNEELATMLHAVKLGYAPWCDYHCENECDDGCDNCIKNCSSSLRRWSDVFVYIQVDSFKRNAWNKCVYNRVRHLVTVGAMNWKEGK